jgi:hypothetical protein
MDEWQTLVDNSKQLKNTIENNYESIEPLIRYLDNENLLKTNLNVKAPSQNVSKDVIEFNE